jgi:hypothetical protein
MQVDAVPQANDTPEPLLGILERHAPDYAVHFVTERQKILGQIASILPGDTGY